MVISTIKRTIKGKTITINKKEFEEYMLLVDLINSERDILMGNYIESDNYKDMVNYLES